MSKASRRRRAALADERSRDESRARVKLEGVGGTPALGSHVGKYAGHTPIVFSHGEANFSARIGGFQNRSRMGTTQRRRDGGLTFVPDRGDVEPKAKPIAEVLPMTAPVPSDVAWGHDGAPIVTPHRAVPVASLASVDSGYRHGSLLTRDLNEGGK